jgi:hypothetical protein
MISFADLVCFNPTAGGTANFTFSSAVGGCQSPALANVQNGATYEYYAVSTDLTQWEAGQGVYNTSTGILSRTTVLYNSLGTGSAAGQSGAGTLINFTLAPQVRIVALAESLTVTQAAAKSDQQAATSAVLAVTPSQQQQHDSAAKAWVSFNGQGTNGACTILTSYNVSGVSRTSSGVYVISFTTPFASANYVGHVDPFSATSIETSQNNLSKTASAYELAVFTAGTTVDPTGVDAVFFGRQ